MLRNTSERLTVVTSLKNIEALKEDIEVSHGKVLELLVFSYPMSFSDLQYNCAVLAGQTEQEELLSIFERLSLNGRCLSITFSDEKDSSLVSKRKESEMTQATSEQRSRCSSEENEKDHSFSVENEEKSPKSS